MGMAVLTTISVVLMLVSIPNLVLSLMVGEAAILKIALALNVAINILSIGVAVMSVVAWKQGYWSLARRAYYTLAAASGLACMWSLSYWNLVGWSF